jgi:hypothetical protein
MFERIGRDVLLLATLLTAARARFRFSCVTVTFIVMYPFLYIQIIMVIITTVEKRINRRLTPVFYPKIPVGNDVV